MPNRTHKARGSAAERELVHLFWDAGWAAFRAPASGSMPIELPDVIAGHGNRKLAIECKLVKEGTKYFTKKEIAELTTFSQRFGCEAWVGVKWLRKGWWFIALDDLRETTASLAVSFADAQRKGLSFEELIR